MDSNIFLALQLLVVGMITVYFILYIVIGLGKVLIILVNKFVPEDKTVKNQKALNVSIDPTTKAIIESTVNQITGGKGSVKSIERI